MTLQQRFVKLGLTEWSLIVLLAAAFTWLLWAETQPESQLGPALGIADFAARGPLPPLALTTIEGKPITNQDLAGKVAVLYFWGTTCPPCVAELPEFRAQYDASLSKNPDFVFVGVASDSDPRTLERFVEGRGLTFPVIAANSPEAKALWGAMDVEWTPTTVIVDPDGEILWRGDRIPRNLPEIIEYKWGDIERESGNSGG